MWLTKPPTTLSTIVTKGGDVAGAGGGTRTHDLLITNPDQDLPEQTQDDLNTRESDAPGPISWLGCESNVPI